VTSRAICLRLPEALYQACLSYTGDPGQVPGHIREILAAHFDINLEATRGEKRAARRLLRQPEWHLLTSNLISRFDQGGPAADLAAKLATALAKRTEVSWSILFHACALQIHRKRAQPTL